MQISYAWVIGFREERDCSFLFPGTTGDGNEPFCSRALGLGARRLLAIPLSSAVQIKRDLSFPTIWCTLTR